MKLREGRGNMGIRVSGRRFRRWDDHAQHIRRRRVSRKNEARPRPPQLALCTRTLTHAEQDRAKLLRQTQRVCDCRIGCEQSVLHRSPTNNRPFCCETAGNFFSASPGSRRILRVDAAGHTIEIADGLHVPTPSSGLTEFRPEERSVCFRLHRHPSAASCDVGYASGCLAPG
jgi:hypothetical protein